jgi:hypothetical protein
MICGDEGEGLGSKISPDPTERIESSAVVKIQRAFRNFLGKKKVMSQLRSDVDEIINNFTFMTFPGI